MIGGKKVTNEIEIFKKLDVLPITKLYKFKQLKQFYYDDKYKSMREEKINTRNKFYTVPQAFTKFGQIDLKRISVGIIIIKNFTVGVRMYTRCKIRIKKCKQFSQYNYSYKGRSGKVRIFNNNVNFSDLKK